MKRPAAVPTVHIDTAYTRATRWTFAPGAETGWHRHELNYVVVPLTSGSLWLETRDAEPAEAVLTAGLPYTRQAGVEHNVVNRGNAEIVFIEIEMK